MAVPNSVAGDRYSAVVEVEIWPKSADGVQLIEHFIPKWEPTVSVKQPIKNIALYKIRVTSANAQAAVDRANKLAEAARDALAKSGDGRKMIIWERAQIDGVKTDNSGN